MFDFNQITERKHTNCVKWDECQNPDVLPLWVADMDFPTAPCIQEAVVRRAAHGCYGYTLVPDAYYQAIQDWFATRHQWNIERDHILYTIGVVPAIAAILKAHCQVGDNVVVLTPIYNCFFNLIRNAGCQAVEVELNANLNHNVNLNPNANLNPNLNPNGATVPCGSAARLSYSINWEALEAALALEKSTVLLFCNPHNPAGRLWSEEEIIRVANLCRQYHVLLLSDEIHNELTPPDQLYTPVGRVLSDNQKSPFEGDLEGLQYVVCSSPSKSFNTAGLQNAFIVCPDYDLRRRIDRAINLNETCDVNPFGVEALIAAYTEGGEWLDELRKYLYDNYRFACGELAAFPELAIADLQGTYLMWVDCRAICKRLGINSAELSHRLIVDHHVWFTAGSVYGHAGEGFLRINLACPRAILSEALHRFKTFLDQCNSTK